MDISDYIHDVSIARQDFIDAISGITREQSLFKPSENEWSVVDNIEHLVWAEMGGINGMWRALEGMKNQTPIWIGVPIHEGKSIEQIVAETWEEKEQVPETAKPRWGGPVTFWIHALLNNQTLLEALGMALEGQDLTKIIHPHPISGPMNCIQRFEFLRFHIERHQKQVEKLLGR